MNQGVGNPLTGAPGFAKGGLDDVAISLAAQLELPVTFAASSTYKRGQLLSITATNTIEPYSGTAQNAAFVLMQDITTGATGTVRVRVAQGVFKKKRVEEASGITTPLSDAAVAAAATRGLYLVTEE